MVLSHDGQGRTPKAQSLVDRCGDRLNLPVLINFGQ
jgi:hypothetical protein